MVTFDSITIFVDENELCLDSPLRNTFLSLFRCLYCRIVFIFHSYADQYDCSDDDSDEGAPAHENVKDVDLLDL